MSVRSDKPEPMAGALAGIATAPAMLTPADSNVHATIDAAAAADSHLGDANVFNTANPEHPLKRSLVVSIRASLAELSMRKNKASWAPSAEAMKAIMQQRKFTDLAGTMEMHGDLKSIVLHSLDVSAQKSTFPFALGARITGVDDSTFSLTGESFATIALPNSETTATRTLQKDDISLAYEFARKFPGYTADNLSDKGIHEVNARRFVLVSADHPLVAAISENAERLQMGDISMMPEGLVKISTSLYNTILPMVKTQVESQIKVRDFANAKVSIQPAEHASWSEARSELMSEAKAGLKARLEAELGSCEDQDAVAQLRSDFRAEERKLEHDIDHTVHTFSAHIDISYNFLSK